MELRAGSSFRAGWNLAVALHQLIATLAEEFEADLHAGTFPEQHKFVKASILAGRFGIDENSVRQQISRARKALENAFLKKLNRQLVPDDIIETLEWYGYRLNPYLRLLKPAQLRQRPSNLSQAGSSVVTSNRTPR
jgi:hypothetical protein